MENGSLSLLKADNYSDFSEATLKYIAKSGIDPEAAKRCGLYSANDERVAWLLKRSDNPGPGTVFPYYDPYTGKPIKVKPVNAKEEYEFVRMHLDNPLIMKNSKLAKKISRMGSGQQPYIPPIIHSQISKAIKHLIFTKGENSSIAGCLAGFIVIGLAGNWGWKKRGVFDYPATIEQDIKRCGICHLHIGLRCGVKSRCCSFHSKTPLCPS